jgi:drug/metabolite transporter (DMT)-like permease
MATTDAPVIHAEHKRSFWMAVAILLFAICLGAVGQILLKSGLGQLTQQTRTPTIGQTLGTIFTNIRVFGGFFCYGISSLFYLVALQKLDLSYAYPMIALSYVLVTYLSWQFLNERVPGLRVLGLAIIIVGVVVMALTYSHTHTSASSTPLPAAVAQPTPPAP